MADLPSQYAEEVETFRHILNLPDHRETMPRSSTSVLGLNDKKHDFLASNLPDGKYIKPPPLTAKWYKVGQPCYEDKIQESVITNGYILPFISKPHLPEFLLIQSGY